MGLHRKSLYNSCMFYYPRSTCACDGYFLNCQQQCGFICVPSVISVCIFSFALVFFPVFFFFLIIFHFFCIFCYIYYTCTYHHGLNALHFWLFPLHNFPHYATMLNAPQHNLLLQTFWNISFGCVCVCTVQVQNTKIASMAGKKTHRFYDYY